MVSGSAALVFLLIVFFLIRRNNIKVGYAILCMLAGFYLAKTSSAPTIDRTMHSLADMFSKISL